MAALLGIPAPRAARGQPLVSWLDVSDETRAMMACANVADVARGLATASGPSVAPACDVKQSPSDRIASALRITRGLDARIDEVDALADRRGFSVSLFAAGATALLSFLLFFRADFAGTIGRRRIAVALALALPFSVFVTANLEKLPGAWLTPARVTLFVVFNAPLVLWLFRPVATSRMLERAPVIAPVLFPGVLVLTETHSALIEAYVLSAILVGFVLTRGIPTSAGFARTWAGAAAPTRLVSWLPLLALAVVCVDAGNFVPPWLQEWPSLRFALALLSLLVFAAVRYRRLRPNLAGTIVCTALAVLSLVLRRHASTSVGIAGWTLLAVLAAVALYRKQRAFAELLAFGSYAWVSRDLEVPLFLASYMVAVGFGEAVAKRLELGASRVLTLSIISFAFAWGYVQFAGIQLGLHFMHFDFAAGAFRDPGVSMARIVIALIYKYAVARGFVLYGILLPLRHPMRILVLRSLVAVYAVRATVLVASLEAARRSFWTPVWVTSELPHVLLALLIVAAAKAFALATAPNFSREASAHAHV
ncbi:MAG: Type phosphodiesterase / nucleotide pyrophosphatase, partial [Myxococcaceae bacterium]|nr:Type phosphodiesterase / nucleotide pyrophosphatase [Myxococcaceae bacterium]